MTQGDRSADSKRGGDDLRSERQRLLLRIFADSNVPLSTTEVARRTEQTLGATAHHVRALARNGYLDWAGERRARGALQTFYVASPSGMEATRLHRVQTLVELAGVPASSLNLDRDTPIAARLEELLVETLQRVLTMLGRDPDPR